MQAPLDEWRQIWFLDQYRQVLVLQAYYPYIAALHNGSWSLEYQRSLPTDYFDGPDNVHVSPHGGLVIAEDGDGLNGRIGWTRKGGAFRLARNEILFRANENEPNDPGENAEMTGPTFSPRRQDPLQPLEGLVDQIFCQCPGGKAVNASSSSLAASSIAWTLGN